MDGLLSVHTMAEAQRSFELRKIFNPEQLKHAGAKSAYDESLNSDGALDAYAETVLWRLRGVHSMVSLIDRGHQYFVAGALRQLCDTPGSESDDDEGVTTQQEWFGCSTVPTPGGLCENTLALDHSVEEYPCFIVKDLAQDPRFKDLAVVDGTLASYRFYAGAPITTDHGINIGSMFMFDDRPRDGLTHSQRKYLHQQAANVLKHLLTKREAAERRRAALMSKGIAGFLEKTAHYRDFGKSNTAEQAEIASAAHTLHSEPTEDGLPTITATPSVSEFPAEHTILEKIRMTLDHAAEILRESLEITSGGVVFLDTALANSEVEKFALELTNLKDDEWREIATPPQYTPLRRRNTEQQSVDPVTLGLHLSQELTRSSEDKNKTPKILAASIPKSDLWNPTTPALNPRTLASLIKAYGKGNVWSIDEEGYFSSWQQINAWERAGLYTAEEQKASLSACDVDRQRLEASMLSQIFPKARQIVFLPLWDAATNRWYSGCFIWSQLSSPVFSVESELTYLSAFTNSMMVEISRLDAVTANKMKSDFIGSISHEFRSPLHGILVSAEFLRDSLLDSSQSELVATIQNCSGTLLDTINHVLDYSKINSFEIAGRQEGPPSSQLYQVTNLALLCESVIEGMVAANTFRPSSVEDAPLSSLSMAQSANERRESLRNTPGPELILDLEHRDWNFKVESGAIQRIIMNLVGNAQKFTTSGFIIVQLKIIEDTISGSDEPSHPILSLRIKDSGKGMSTEFMQRKLYQPFAQEDSFVPGVGLGLSIVWSIVNQLNGKIKMRSELDKGTDVEVTIPVEKAGKDSHTQNKSGELLALPDPELLLTNIRQRVAGQSVSFSRRATATFPRHRKLSWACLERYFAEWFGFEVKQTMANVVVTDQHHDVKYVTGQRSLIIHEHPDLPATGGGNGVASICDPIGPFKLARTIMALLDQEVVVDIASADTEVMASTSDVATQTPPGSPEERTILDGISMTDYGFSTPATSHTSSKTSQTSVIISCSARPAGEDDPLITASTPLSKMALALPHRKALHLKQNSMPLVIGQAADSPPQKLPQSIPLPASPTRSPFPPGTPHMRATSKSSKPALRVLAVDDNTLNLQLLHRYLQGRKQDVIATATNGVEALDAVRRADEPFDVIFMDISMPEMDGFEATRLIRSFERAQMHRSHSDLELDSGGWIGGSRFETSQATKRNADGLGDRDRNMSSKAKHNEEGDEPMVVERWESGKGRAYIVALTGLASRRDRNEAEQSGLDDFLTKPISFKRIGELLDRLSWEK